VKKQSNLNSGERTAWQNRLPALIAGLLLGVTCCLGTSAADEQSPLKVGFLCVGSVNDNGWNFAHNRGRLNLERSLGKKVQTTIAEKIPESAEAERVMEKMIAQGDKLIFSTSYGYLEPATRVAARHPDVTFMQVNRFAQEKNLGTYFSWQYQPMYVAGVVAGRMTKTNKLGFIAAHPVPALLQSINAFTMGARSVNPKVSTRVIFINSWSDPVLEIEAMKTLKNTGVDVLAHAQDSQNAIMSNAPAVGMKVVGYYTDSHQLAPKNWLTGACLDWGPLYTKIAQAVIEKTWTPAPYKSGMEGGYIKLSSFGESVPEEVRREAEAVKNKIATGKLIVYKGPLKDREGKVRLAPGKEADQKWLAELSFFVDGVEGALPR
jgi:basic membrane protein A and related proteins